MKTLNISIKGTAPLLLHNGQTRDPLNPYVKRMKEISKKRTKTDQDFVDLADIEWEAGLYLNEDKKIIIPALNLEACIKNGGKKSKLGKSIQAGLMVNDDTILEYSGPKDLETLRADRNFRFTVGAKIQRNAIMRTRPRFKDWGLTFGVTYDERVLNESEVIKAIEDAGLYCGIGDWLPRFGRFEIIDVK